MTFDYLLVLLLNTKEQTSAGPFKFRSSILNRKCLHNLFCDKGRGKAKAWLKPALPGTGNWELLINACISMSFTVLLPRCSLCQFTTINYAHARRPISVAWAHVCYVGQGNLAD